MVELAVRRLESILVVDDDASFRLDVCRILRAQGYTAIPAGRGPEAQWCVEEHGTKLHLLLADFAGPEVDDYHLGIPISRLFPHVSVLFMSYGSKQEGVRRGLLHHATPFLRKPFPPTVLTRTVREVLDQRRHQRPM